MNHRAKFDAASFILGGEIRNRTHTQNYKKGANKQTVTDISTPCLSSCVDNNGEIAASAIRRQISITASEL